MKLLDHPLPSLARKVEIALREKGLPFGRHLPEDFGTGRDDTDLARANALREAPVLVVGGDMPTFGSVILGDLERRFPERALLPSDPLGCAAARMAETICDTQSDAVNGGWGEILRFRRAEAALAERLLPAARRETGTLLVRRERRLGREDGFGGERFGHGDLAVAPTRNRSVSCGNGPAPESPLGRWHARVRMRPAFAETFAAFAEAAERMGARPDLHTTGGRRREDRGHRLEWMVRSGDPGVVGAGFRDGSIRFSWPERA